ncbi:MAG: efflux RND transporter periplasmic adaptor subunit, partial [Deltaproteobacteria bacterium]|nr:efflux RND transporter periplasmic adaptor subunit [Deltaproteobacteria bacterium]
KAGDFLSVGKPVAQILQIDQVKVKVGVPESDVAAVFDLQTAEVVIDALGGLRVEGRKTFLSRQPRTLARLYDLELKIDNPDGRILPGMFVRVELVKRVFTGALVVPLYAVIVMDNQQVVFVEKENKVFRRPVKLGVLEGWQVQVTQGLRPQEKVVVVGHRFLEDGQTVEVLKTVQDPKEILRP